MAEITRIAYLLLVHKCPEQVAFLVEGLTHPGSRIYIHVDAKIDEQPYREKLAAYPQVHFISSRVSVHWGGYSIVQAMLNLLAAAHRDGVDRHILLSGEDYPIKSQQQIQDFYRNNSRDYVGYEPLTGYLTKRARNYYFYDGPPWLAKAARIFGTINRRTLNIPFRRPPAGIKLYKGTMWWSFADATVARMLQLLADRPEIERYFRYFEIADESLFHTLLANFPLSVELVNDDLRLINWIQGKPSPEILTEADWQILTTSRHWFARKFDWNKSRGVLERLRRHLRNDDDASCRD